MLPIFEPSDVYSSTFIASGSMRSGEVFERPMLAPLTNASGSSFSPGRVLPTTTAMDSEASGLGSGIILTDAVVCGRVLPTPEAKLATSGPDRARPTRRSSGGHDLASAVALLPTPNAMVSNDGESAESWLSRREKLKAKLTNGNGAGMPLTVAVQLIATGARTEAP